MLTIGQRLKKERETRFISLDRASDDTHIRKVFLKALEADDYSVMPSAAQGRGFLRNYSKYLDIDVDEIIAELQRNPIPIPPEVSGPLEQVDLEESGVPPLTESEEDEDGDKRPFWTAWLRAKRQTSIAVDEIPNSSPMKNEPPVELEASDDKAMSEEPPQAEAESEAQPNPIKRLVSLLSFRRPATDVETQPISNVEQASANLESHSIPTAQSSSEIFAEIGRQLRERRELISLTIEEVVRHTKFKEAYIRALEEGALDGLPSPVQTRGMLANYASFLDLDVDAILLRFADSLQARHREKYSETPRDKIQTEVRASIPLFRGFIAGDLIFGIVIIGAIMALGIWGINRVVSSQNEDRQAPTSLPIVNVLADQPSETPAGDETSAPVNGNDSDVAAPGILETPTFNVDANINISILAVERTYLRVLVDGETAFDGRMAPQETRQLEAQDQVEILTGNAAALRITFNGRDLGLMGNVGEVVDRVYTISGVVTPTSTQPPTSTNTPLITNTPTPTQTPTATATEASSP